MEKEISEIAESLQRISGNEDHTLFHEGCFEFDVPKLPIEVKEMKNHILSRQLARWIIYPFSHKLYLFKLLSPLALL